MYAVITGDLVKSSHLEAGLREKLLQSAREWYLQTSGNAKAGWFDVFRGDSIQALVLSPEDALELALELKFKINLQTPSESGPMADIRCAVGIGAIEHFQENIKEMDGEALRLSGKTLDGMRTGQHICIRTPWEDLNGELEVYASALDYLINSWTLSQREVIYYQLKRMKQTQIAEKLSVSQSAVNQRLKSAGWHLVNQLLNRYRIIIRKRIGN